MWLLGAFVSSPKNWGWSLPQRGLVMISWFTKVSRTENYTNFSTDINSYWLCVWKLETVWVQQKNSALTSDFLLRIAVSWEHHTDRELWKEEYQLDINPNDKVVCTFFFSLSLVHRPTDLRTRKSPHTTEASFSRSWLPLRSEGGT